MVLRIISGPKRDDMVGGCSNLHNEEPHNLYTLPSIIRMIKSRMMRWARSMASLGEKRNVHRALVGKPEGNIPLRRPRRR
jgi:hypothetical protein